MKWIRDQYGVPARRGGRIAFEGRPGRITAVVGPHLRAQLDDGEYVILHPTWHVEYLGVDGMYRAADIARRYAKGQNDD